MMGVYQMVHARCVILPFVRNAPIQTRMVPSLTLSVVFINKPYTSPSTIVYFRRTIQTRCCHRVQPVQVGDRWTHTYNHLLIANLRKMSRASRSASRSSTRSSTRVGSIQQVYPNSKYVQTTGSRRMRKAKNHDQYFIDKGVMEQCVEIVKNILQGEHFDTIIDPCVGPAHYADILQKHFRNATHVYSDVDPKYDWIEKRDFLKRPHYTVPPKGNKVLTFANPPFENLKSSDAFIRTALKFSSAAAFIIPNIYRKHKRPYELVDDYCQIVHEVDLPANIFTVNGRPHRWKCILQIWRRLDTPRKPISYSIEEPRGYELVTKCAKNRPNLWLHAMGKHSGTALEQGESIGSPDTKWGFKSPLFISNKEMLRNMINGCCNFSATGSRRTLDKNEVIQKVNILVDYITQPHNESDKL